MEFQSRAKEKASLAVMERDFPEAVEEAGQAQDIETNAKILRESDGSREAVRPNFEAQDMN